MVLPGLFLTLSWAVINPFAPRAALCRMYGHTLPTPVTQHLPVLHEGTLVVGNCRFHIWHHKLYGFGHSLWVFVFFQKVVVEPHAADLFKESEREGQTEKVRRQCTNMKPKAIRPRPGGKVHLDREHMGGFRPRVSLCLGKGVLKKLRSCPRKKCRARYKRLTDNKLGADHLS